MQIRGRLRRTIALGAALTALTAGAVSAVTFTPTAAGTEPVVPRGAKPLSEARILFELNATARDAGIQMLLDGENWRWMKVYDTEGKLMLRVQPSGSVADIGMTELFFESAEPSLADLPLAGLFKKFPEGDYTVVAKTVEGDTLVGIAPLTHEIPGSAKVRSPKKGATTSAKSTMVKWKPVTRPAGITIDHYQVIVETADDPLRILSLEVDADVSQVAVPPTFLQPHTEYKLEVIAVEESLNQTITESTFRTR